MTVQFSDYAIDHFIAPGLSAFEQADIPDLRAKYDQHMHWLSNHFLNSLLRGSFSAPYRQFAVNAIYRVQTTFREYHEARDLTHHYLNVRRPGRPATQAYFIALARWESCILNWSILADVYYRMTDAKVFDRDDGSPDQRAYDMCNAIKHCGQAIRRAEYGDSLTVPMWLMNDGFHTRHLFLSYLELSTLVGQAADFADRLQDPRTFVEPLHKVASDGSETI
jgi:hypothetical protein